MQEISVTNSYISNSVAGIDGGAVYSARSVTLTNTNVENSVSQSGRGGAIYSLEVNITNSTIRNITANGDGGAIFITGNKVRVINSTISQSLALNGSGGAAYSATNHSNVVTNLNSDTNVIFSRSTFSDNHANNGGVLYVNGHYNHCMEINDSTFEFNETGDGGVAYTRNTSLSITNSEFNNNMATTLGGVLDLSFSSVSIRQSTLSWNTAGDKGGAFYGRNYSTNFTIVQTTFKHNTAFNGGVVLA